MHGQLYERNQRYWLHREPYALAKNSALVPEMILLRHTGANKHNKHTGEPKQDSPNVLQQTANQHTKRSRQYLNSRLSLFIGCSDCLFCLFFQRILPAKARLGFRRTVITKSLPAPSRPLVG
jgi:hypothetical protein